MKTIMVVGGGKWQVPIVKKIKELGHIVVCSNLYVTSPAFEFADFFYVADVLDKEKNLEIARLHKVDAVVTDQSDIAVKTVAYINDKLSLFGVGTNMAELFTNKFRMRQELLVEGLFHPKYRLCSNIEELKVFFSFVNTPIIIKPIDSQSSRGIRLIKKSEEIEEAYAYTISFTHNNVFIAEEFIDGIELTVEGYKFLDGDHHTFAVSKKSYFQDIIGIADTLQYQPVFDEFNVEKIKKINDQLFSRLPFGITHVEYKVLNGDFYLIEAAIRGGGTKISSMIVPMLSGNDTNYFLIENALGHKIYYKDNGYQKKYGVLKFFSFSGGVVEKIFGLDIQKYNKNILDLDIEFMIGDTLLPPSDDRSRVGYFIAVGNTLEQLEKTVKDVESTFYVTYKKEIL